MPGPLDGVRVLDFTEFIAGPLAGMLLADMGADVIKVEPPWGEPWRVFRQIMPLESRQYIAVNRGKHSLPLDLRQEAAQEVVHRLAAGTDVAMVNFRRDVPSRLGIDYATLSSKNPRIIYCENTPFGSSGPMSHLPGYDIIIQAMTGILASEGNFENGIPRHVASPFVDTSSGMSMVAAICGALYQRERSGRVQKIETSMVSVALWSQPARYLHVEYSDHDLQRQLIEDLATMRKSGSSFQEVQAVYRAHHTAPPGHIYYRIYQTQDGVMAIGCLNDSLSRKLLEVLGLRDIRLEPGYNPESPGAEGFGEKLTAEAERLVRSRSTAEWLELLSSAGVPAASVKFAEEMLEDEQAVVTGAVVDLQHPLVGNIKMPGPLFQMSETPVAARAAPPTLGQHTDEILSELGYSEDQVRQMRESGAVR